MICSHCKGFKDKYDFGLQKMVPCPQCKGRGSVMPVPIDIGVFVPDPVDIVVTCNGCHKQWRLPRQLAPDWIPSIPICIRCGWAWRIEYINRETNMKGLSR